MRIAFSKVGDDRHRLAIHRADGSSEAVELETRSYLLHDLVHYAVEAEVPIADGFWGLLADGWTLAALSDRTMKDPPSTGIALAERLVGPMQSLWQGRYAEAMYLERAPAEASIDAAFVARVRARLRALTGHWRATPFGGAMEISWPPH